MKKENLKKRVLVIVSTMIPLDKSYSYTLVKKFLSYYIKKNKEDEITVLNLNDTNMAHTILNSHNFGPKFFNKEDSEDLINNLRQFDKLIFSTPMTNFNISTIAKNYLDHILVADKTFSYKYSKKGRAIGLLTHLRVQILTTQGAPMGWYKWGNLGKYLYGTWKFMGCDVLKPLTIGGTKIPFARTISIKEFINQYEKKIKKLAYKF